MPSRFELWMLLFLAIEVGIYAVRVENGVALFFAAFSVHTLGMALFMLRIKGRR